MRSVVISIVAAVVLACGGRGSSGAGSDESETGTSSSSGSDSSTASSDASSSSSTTTESSTGEPIVPWSGPLSVMTFNVLCSLCSSEFDPWDDRVPWMADTIMRHDPDLVGLQEIVYAEEVQQILDATPGYTAVFYDEGELPYPDATVLFRDELFELVDHGFYWLSPTPDQARSTGFADGFQLARLVVWTVLRRRDDGAELFFANTHFDNNSPSQELSAPLVLERTAPFVDGRPVVFVGDFNSDPSSEAYAILTGGDPFVLENAFDLAPEWTMETNQEPAPDYDTSQRIDHVFVAGVSWTATRWVVDTWIYGRNDLYVSDHFAIATELELEG